MYLKKYRSLNSEEKENLGKKVEEKKYLFLNVK